MIAVLPLLSATSHAKWTSDDEMLSLGADAEINFDIIDNQKGISFVNNDITINKNTHSQLNDDSRVRFTIEWENLIDDKYFIVGKAQPLFRTDATYFADDIYLGLGQKDRWEFQIGRFEALDLFPLGKDIALFYAAGSDGIGAGVYYYMAKEARGRSNSAGQARIIGEKDNWTAELATIYGQTDDILASSTVYLNNESFTNNLSSENNTFILRPAVNYKSSDGFFSVSFGRGISGQ